MEHADALDLIRAAIAPRGGRWADLGAGGGRFTLALAELLGPEGEVHAVDLDPGVERLARAPSEVAARIIAHVGDFSWDLGQGASASSDT
ncbi:hypothetical protein BH23DEI1_BH23DEI1_06140 [soil metagenome]